MKMIGFDSHSIHKQRKEHYAKSRHERIETRKLEIGSRQDRKRHKHSDKFIEIFRFFLQSYRRGILDFCGSKVVVDYDKNGKDGMIAFKEFENGLVKLHQLSCKHPNVLRGVIVGKKSWGLWLQEWTNGISEGSFTIREILDEFDGIIIPKPLLRDFYNVLHKKIMMINSSQKQ